jgi:protein-tyrosine-phosphatase
MAEALARHYHSDVMEASSAGISPLGRIAEPTLKVLQERGVRADGQHSKGLHQADPDSAHLIINMTGIPGRSLFAGAAVLDWDVADPYGEDLQIYREVCDDIEERLNELAEDLRAKRRALKSA